MANQRYAELLRDPRWQLRAAQALVANGGRCEICGETRRTLNVHHPRYYFNRAPWEYTNDELMVLCRDCHEDQHGLSERAMQLKYHQREMARAHERGDWDSMMAHAEAGWRLVQGGTPYKWMV